MALVTDHTLAAGFPQTDVAVHQALAPVPVPLLSAGPSLAELEAALAAPAVTLVSLNVLLYRCDAEERDESGGSRGVYDVPGYGRLAWAGLAGVAPLLRHCRRWNDMGHALAVHLRAGSWLLDYTEGRLEAEAELAAVRAWLRAHFALVRTLPPDLRPQAFDRVVAAAFFCAVAAAVARMPSPLLNGSGSGDYDDDEAATAVPHGRSLRDLISVPWPAAAAAGVRAAVAAAAAARAFAVPAAWGEAVEPLPLSTALALASVQLYGVVHSAPLLGLALLLPPEGDDDEGGGGGLAELRAAPASLAAGVEHFSTGFMRAWGRDTCMSLRGLLLCTGRWAEARETLLAFATVLRHGLVPNLMDGGRSPRFNCRDAVWWWAQALQDYCAMAPEGAARFLRARVHRRFPSDDPTDYDASTGDYAPPPGRPRRRDVMPLADVLQEALQAHAGGISFREWHAGPAIDSRMSDTGFLVQSRLDAATGLVHGGSTTNCGTWMDKMGESDEWGTSGVPATPRDGAAVEITGLVYSTVAWLASGVAESSGVGGWWPHAGVELPGGGGALSYAAWAQRLRASFDRCYYVPLDPAEDAAHGLGSGEGGEGRFVSVRGMFRDTVGSTGGWPDFQLRPSALVAMTVAPGLFDPAHAAAALETIEHRLLGEHQLGVKTLDPGDWAYRPDYDNSSTASRETARGWNYHQGPEWLWPFGYYLRARLAFPPAAAAAAATVTATAGSTSGWTSAVEVKRWIGARLRLFRAHLDTSPAGALPELTNAGGAFCGYSCVSQAWSAATALDALWDAAALQARLPR